jgi:DNA topoisomerase VI subunit B
MQNDTVRITGEMATALMEHARYLAAPLGSKREKNAKQRRQRAFAKLDQLQRWRLGVFGYSLTAASEKA